MEPSDFDNLIRQKMQEPTDLHQEEMEKAKPFVWYAVQDRVNQKPMLRWYHLAAAVVLLFAGFSWIVFYLQKGHEQEIANLSSEMQQLKTVYANQSSQSQLKDNQVQLLECELEEVSQQLAQLENQTVAQSTFKSQIIYQTDTVFVKQVEYVTVYKERETMQPNMDSLKDAILSDNNELMANAETDTNKQNATKSRDNLIFARSSKNTSSTNNPDLKVRLGGFPRTD